jgi:hemerythrin-like domain-containing protein
MLNPVAVWHAEHMRFARLLDFIEQQMAVFHAGRRPNYELMREVLHYMRHFADRYHHPREDVAFARMGERDPDMKVRINRLLQEHRVIGVAGESLLGYLDDILQDIMVRRARVEAAAATYLVYYRHHLDTEESTVLPRAAQVLTPDDWSAVASAVPPVPDPLFGDDVLARYRELRAQLPRAGPQSA